MNIKRILATVAFLTFVVSSLFGAYSMHKAANPEQAPTPVWAKTILTVNDPILAEYAQAWNGPFEIVYSVKDADITVEHTELEGIEGDAETVVEDGHIVSCHIRVDPDYYGPTLAQHEFGHCLGLKHENPNSLMGKYAGADTITASDRKALARIYG